MIRATPGETVPSAAEWEDWCLETFFLNAAVDGKIDAIEIDDEKIIEFSGAVDLSGAHREFLSVLPMMLDDYLKGDLSPSFRAVGKAASRSLSASESRPNFLRILMFFLWLQITASKDEDEGDIRRMATSALRRQSPQVLVGLHNMWNALARWLREHRDIVLDLPAHGNETHVGITKRLAFPTKKDLDLLRRVRDDSYSSTEIRSVTRRIAGDSYFDRTSPAFRRAFFAWRSAAEINEEAARELPFMSAWTRVLAEKEIDTSIILSCDEFGELELEKRLADGRTTTIQSNRDLIQECNARGGIVARRANKGMIALRRTGLASWIVTGETFTEECLISAAALGKLTPADRLSIRTRGEIRYLSWVLCNVGDRQKSDTAAPTGSTLRFVDKIRVGARGTYLGRWPLTPRIAYPGKDLPNLSGQIGTHRSVPAGTGLAAFSGGVWDGAVQASSGARTASVALRSNAYPHADEDIRFFDRSRHVSEDGPLGNTEPVDPSAFPVGPSNEGSEPDPRLLALQEALYARSARTIPLGTAVEMASRVSLTEDAPDVWSLVRLFVDSGWFDNPSVSQVPARLLVQRRPGFRRRANAEVDGVSIEGPMPLLLEDALRRKAETFDLRFERRVGRTAWSIPKIWVGSPDAKALTAFLQASDLNELNVSISESGSKKWSDTTVADEFEITGTWDSSYFRFGGHYESEGYPRLLRMDRPARDSFARYVVEHEDGRRETFGSANLALLRYLDVRNECAFLMNGDGITATHARFRLPASWARWLATVHLRNCALERMDGADWTCVYAASTQTSKFLSNIYPALHVKSATRHTESGILPWMEKTRLRCARDCRPIWHAGKLKATHDLDGLRTR